jgi:hypothetical protein
MHPPDALTNGHIAYLVKFLGVTEAEHPKGIEVVKDSIRKLKLDEEIRRAEGGKTPKAEVTISVDGVAIQEPRGKRILHQFPLHQISYCADDKEEKRFFSFIAKEGDTHKCFVFASEKLAEEITLTIGQAFDLAYRRFLDSSGREMELKKEIMTLEKRVADLESENLALKDKLSMRSVDGNSNSSLSSSTSTNGGGDVLICGPPPVPPRESANVANQIFAEFAMTANEIEKRAHVGRQLEGLLFDEELDPKPRGTPDGIEAPPRISPPPKGKKTDMFMNGGGQNSSDIFGSDPFFTSSDPFGMSDFSNGGSNGSGAPVMNGTSQLNGLGLLNGYNNNQSSNTNQFNGFGHNGSISTIPFPNSKPQELESSMAMLDRRIEEMKLGFSRGIVHEDVSLEMLDPLRSSK